MAFAYANFFDTSLHVHYKPFASLQESKLIREWATACIDTSDGLFPALSVLSGANDVGVRLTTPMQDLLCEESLKVYREASLPAWMFMAGPHGEYRLLFTIPASTQNEFEDNCGRAGWVPLLLGEITNSQQLEFVTEQTTVRCQPAVIPNLFGEAGGDVQVYLQKLMEKQRQWSTAKTSTVC